MKKLLSIIIVLMPTLNATLQDVINKAEKYHTQETNAMLQATDQLIQYLSDKELSLWKTAISHNLKKGIPVFETTYPALLSTNDAKLLINEITTFSNLPNERLAKKYVAKLPRNSIVAEIFELIRSNALAINAIDNPFLKENIWKPIIKRYFNLVKGILLSFSPNENKTESSDLYFSKQTTGGLLKKL